MGGGSTYEIPGRGAAGTSPQVRYYYQPTASNAGGSTVGPVDYSLLDSVLGNPALMHTLLSGFGGQAPGNAAAGPPPQPPLPMMMPSPPLPPMFPGFPGFAGQPPMQAPPPSPAPAPQALLPPEPTPTPGPSQSPPSTKPGQPRRTRTATRSPNPRRLFASFMCPRRGAGAGGMETASFFTCKNEPLCTRVC